MQPLLANLLTRLAAGVDVLTGLIIAFAVGEATLRTVGLYFAGRGRMSGDHESVRLRFGKWLALALEFALASDIIRTAVAPSWDDIGKLGAIMALRTVLNYFLERELEQAARVEPEAIRAAA